jgi:hypothetical protein
VFSARHGDRRYQHVSLAAAHDLDIWECIDEYASRPALVELAVDDGESFRAASDAPGFYLVGRELPLDQPLDDGETPVGIFKVYFW